MVVVEARPDRVDVDPVVGFLARAVGWVLAVGGAIGAAAAFALILDRIALLEDPAYVPSCSISPLLSCGSVMTSPQAELFGFPNPLLGVVAFPVVATMGVAVLAGATLPRWYWLGLQGGVVAGTVLVHWLIFQSLYRIGSLCPYCMVVWVVVLTIATYVTLHNLTAGRFGGAGRGVRLARLHGVVLAVWLLVVVVLILEQFWSYWVSVV